MPVRAIRATITGRVQGVGFRWATRRVAVDLGVSGGVRNLADGSVEVMARGSDEAIAALVGFLEHGPPGAIVAGVLVEDVEPDHDPDGFEITT